MSFLRNIQQRLAQWSLMARLTLFVSIFFIFVWLLVASHTWNKDSQQSKKFFDTQIVLLAKTIAALHIHELEDRVTPLYEAWPIAIQESYGTITNDAYSFAVFSQTGEPIFYDSKFGKNFPFLNDKGFVNTEIQGKEWRIFYYTNPHEQSLIAVGYELDSHQSVILEMLISHITPWCLFLLCFLVGFRLLLQYEFKALQGVVKNLQSRKAQETKPLEITGLTAEIRPLVEALNSLFSRTTEFLERERSFVANAAHELRTPLSGLRLQVEVLERKIDDTAARNSALRKIIEGSIRCTRLVDQLLLLSSLESKSDSMQGEQKKLVPWNSLLQSAEEDILDSAIAKDIAIEFTATSTNIVSHGLPEFWNIVLRNMLDNAVRYTPKGGIVRAVLQEDLLYVENSAPHLSEDVLKSLGQRFYRPAGQQELGSGLGLAIMRHIAELHHTDIKIENIEMNNHEGSKIQGFRVSVKFN